MGGRRVSNFRNLSSSTLLSNFALVIMAPQRTDLVLASDIPHLRWQPTVMEVALVQMFFSLFEKKNGEFLGESMLMLVFWGGGGIFHVRGVVCFLISWNVLFFWKNKALTGIDRPQINNSSNRSKRNLKLKMTWTSLPLLNDHSKTQTKKNLRFQKSETEALWSSSSCTWPHQSGKFPNSQGGKDIMMSLSLRGRCLGDVASP